MKDSGLQSSVGAAAGVVLIALFLVVVFAGVSDAWVSLKKAETIALMLAVAVGALVLGGVASVMARHSPRALGVVEIAAGLAVAMISTAPMQDGERLRRDAPRPSLVVGITIATALIADGYRRRAAAKRPAGAGDEAMPSFPMGRLPLPTPEVSSTAKRGASSALAKSPKAKPAPAKEEPARAKEEPAPEERGDG